MQSYKIDDSEVISAILDSEVNPITIKKFYEAHRKSFIKFAKLYYKVDDLFAIEVYQEAQYIMYTNFIDGRVKDLKSSLKTYLFSIGKNLILNEFKRRGQYEEFKDIHISNKLAELDQIEVENEHTRKMTIVREAVSVLKDPCKSILTYFYWAKKKLDVILTLMPNYNSIDALKVQKYKCMQRLEKLVKAEFAKLEITI